LSAAVIRTVLRLDVPVALTMSSEVTNQLIRQLKPRQTEIVDKDTGINLPIIDTIHNLASGQDIVSKEGFVVLCRKERLVLIWNDTVDSILAQGDDIETWLVGLVWGSQVPSAPGKRSASPFGARISMSSVDRGNIGNNNPKAHRSAQPSPQVSSTPMYGTPSARSEEQHEVPLPPEYYEKFGVIRQAIAREEEGDRAFDPERDGAVAPTRPFCLTHALCIALAMVLVVLVELSCVASEFLPA
jgi:hypothetical protein